MTPKPHVYLRNTIWARTGQATQTASGGRPGLAPGLWSVQSPRGQSGLCLGLGIPVLPLTNWRSLSSLGVSSPVKWGYARTPAQGGGDGGGHRPGPARTRRSNRARRRYPSQPICRRIYSTGDSGARLSPLSSPTVSGDALGFWHPGGRQGTGKWHRGSRFWMPPPQLTFHRWASVPPPECEWGVSQGRLHTMEDE